MPDQGYQRRFHARYARLANPPVRDLAWLLDSPDMLDAGSAHWSGRIATLFAHQGKDVDDWLHRLDEQLAALQALVERHGFNRLGRYAELLLAFFLEHIGVLQAHGLQVRAASGETLGEFDFLLRDPASRLVHWEFATKFYLLEPGEAAVGADSLIGPNLADTLGAKMRKILERQLSLSQHPAARAALKEVPSVAQALIKGWLFYPRGYAPASPVPGVNPDHCHGFWQPLSAFAGMDHDSFVVLPRLRWLAPARSALPGCMNKSAALQALENHFAKDNLPVMLALMEADDEGAFEIERGFIVPDDWTNRARQFARQ